MDRLVKTTGDGALATNAQGQAERSVRNRGRGPGSLGSRVSSDVSERGTDTRPLPRRGRAAPSPTQLGRRLRNARKSRGRSRQDVAEVLNLPVTAVADMENGVRAVSVDELDALGRFYRCSASSFHYPKKEEAKEELFAILRRKCPEMEPSSEIGSEMWRFLEYFVIGMSLRKFLGRTFEQRIPDYSGRVTRADTAILQGETAAEEERRRLGLGHAPVWGIPDLVSLQGAWVVETALPEGLLGLSMSHSAVGTAIFVSRQDDPVRKRLSYAHGYAHALFDRGETVTVTRGERSTGLMGIRANAFASAFLMPTRGVESWLMSVGKGQPGRHTHVVFDEASGSPTRAEMRPRPASQTITHQDVAMLARHYGVGFEAMAWRLRNLRHVGDTKARELIGQRELGEAHLRLVGYGDLAGDTGNAERVITSQLIHLGTEAFRQGRISRGRLAEIGRGLGIEREHLLRLAFATCPDLDKIPVWF